MSRASKHALRFTAAIAALPFLVSAGGTTCFNSSGDCTSETKLRIWTGSPTIPCQRGKPVIRIDSTAVCGQSTAGPVSVYRCSNSSAGFSYTGTDGTTHSFSVLTNWGNALYSCDELIYWAI
jgi:hypothetical protein